MLARAAVNVVGVMAVTVTISLLEPSEFAIVRAMPTSMSVMAAGVTVCAPVAMLAAMVVLMPALMAESGTVGEVTELMSAAMFAATCASVWPVVITAPLSAVEHLVTQIDELDPVVIRGRSHQGKEHTRCGAPAVEVGAGSGTTPEASLELM